MSGARFASVEDRFWAKVTKGPDCWEWQAKRSHNGYGRFGLARAFIGAHVMSYELTYGDVPEGLEVHHTCENRGCVNPAHLRAVTHRENLLASDTLPGINARKTHCIHGHEFTPANTYITRDGKRRCRRCDADRARAYKARRRAERLGHIGDNPEEREYEPLEPYVPIPEPTPAPAPVAPEPEKVPA